MQPIAAPPPVAPAVVAPTDPAEPTTPPGTPGPDEYPTNAVIAGFRGTPHSQFAQLIPPEGLQICERQAENVGQVFRSPDRGCHTVTAAQVTAAYWRSTLRDQVAGTDRVTCEPFGDGERCATPPIRNDPPHGRVWYLNAPPGLRIVRRVVSWSIDG